MKNYVTKLNKKLSEMKNLVKLETLVKPHYGGKV